jgi:hypothetical protein
MDCARIVGLDLPEEPLPEGPKTKIHQVVSTYYVDGQRFDEVIDTGDLVPDTVPLGSWLWLAYNGTPGASESFCLDPYNQCITYQKSIEWQSSRLPGLVSTTAWLPEDGEDNDPFGTADSTSLSMGTVDYKVRLRAVDEFGVPDPTPAEVPIVANFQPTLDEFGIEHYDGTLVGDGGSVVWDWWNPANYHGSRLDTLDFSNVDTLYVVKEFYFVIRGDGHDHPKEASTGGVKSWLYQIRETEYPWDLVPFAQSGFWTDAATVNTVSDTVRLVVSYPHAYFDPEAEQEAFANLPDWFGRSYDLAIQGRDTKSTDEFSQWIYVERRKTLVNRYNIAPVGRLTGEGRMTFSFDIVR